MLAELKNNKLATLVASLFFMVGILFIIDLGPDVYSAGDETFLYMSLPWVAIFFRFIRVSATPYLDLKLNLVVYFGAIINIFVVYFLSKYIVKLLYFLKSIFIGDRRY